ncbi:hypothetical protein GCM10009830_11390 [Glycomyces endophyticus]|uniref:Uncharacterized protein n=1 Tax=Glycomyces endophyticus TaxID=480996 RepID=A0ABN2G9T6_9ACTN
MLVLAAAATPVYAQDEESGGEVLCEIHDSRVADATAVVPTADGDGWWVLPDGNGQTDGMMTIRQVGGDCSVRDTEAGSLAIDWLPIDPEDMTISEDFLWIADIGDPDGEREQVSMTQVSTSDASDFTMTRYVYPDGPQDAEAFFLLPDRTPVFIASKEGEAPLYMSDGLGQEEGTPLELAGTVALPEGAGAVTGAAISADGAKVALRTGDSAYEWDVADGDVVASMTGAEPRTTPLDDGGGDIAYDADGNFVTVAQTGDEASPAAISRYTPAAPVAEEEPAGEDEAAPAEDEGGSFVDWVLGLGFGTIVKILATIAILGLLVMVLGIVVIRKYKKQNAEADDEDEPGFAREDSDYGRGDFLADDDPVDLGLESGHPDPDLGQVARGNVYGGGPARQEPSGNVYGGGPARQEPSGNVYGGGPARQEPSGNVYGGGPRREQPPARGGVYGGREEPQYGAFEGGGHGSVYDNSGPGPGQSFAARQEPSGNVYGGGPARQEPSGNVYGAQGGAQGRPQHQQQQGRRGGDAERAPDADEGYWGPPDGGTTYGRNR